MASHISEIEKNVQRKYLTEELQIETKLRQLSLDSEKQAVREVHDPGIKREKDNQQALKRNRDLLKEIEKTSARLRSQTLYSPTDEHLEAAKVKYIRKLKELRAHQSTREVLQVRKK